MTTEEALKWEDTARAAKCKIDICELSDELFAAVGDFAPKYCRVVEVLLTPWNRGKKIVALSPTCLFVFDLEGHLERFLRLNEIKKIERMEGEVRLGLRGKEKRVQLLLRTPDDQKDLLFHMIRDRKNTGDNVNEIFDVLNQITNQVYGTSIPVEEMEPTEPLEGRADLKSEHPNPADHLKVIAVDDGIISLAGLSKHSSSSSSSSSSSIPNTPSAVPSVPPSVGSIPPTPPLVATPSVCSSKQPAVSVTRELSASPILEPPAARTPEITVLPTKQQDPEPPVEEIQKPAKKITRRRRSSPRIRRKSTSKQRAHPSTPTEQRSVVSGTPESKQSIQRQAPVPMQQAPVSAHHTPQNIVQQSYRPPLYVSPQPPVDTWRHGALNQIKNLEIKINNLDCGRESQLMNLTHKLNEIEHTLECLSPRSRNVLRNATNTAPSPPSGAHLMGMDIRKEDNKTDVMIPMDASLIFFEVYTEGHSDPYYWHVSSGNVQWKRPTDPKAFILPHTKDVVRMIVSQSKPTPQNIFHTQLVAALGDISLAPTAPHFAAKLYSCDPTLLYSALSEVLPGVAYGTIQRQWRQLLNNYVDASLLASKRLREKRESR